MRRDRRDSARNVFGKVGVAYPDSSLAHPTYTERADVRPITDAIAFDTEHPQHTGAYLVRQIWEEGDGTNQNRLWVYETLPGPQIFTPQDDNGAGALGVSVRQRVRLSVTDEPTAPGGEITYSGNTYTINDAVIQPDDSAGCVAGTMVLDCIELPGDWLPSIRYEDRDLGYVQQRRRLVLAADQAVTVSRTGKVYYESFNGSSIISWEIEDIYSDGTGSSSANPLYPVVGAPLYYDDERGAVSGYTQIVQSVQKVTAATVAAGGSGGSNGTQFVTGTTGTGTKFVASVQVVGGIITQVNSIFSAGLYTVRPTDIGREPVTGASLTGAKLSLTMEPSEVGSLLPSSTLATWTRYEPFNEFLLRKVVERWTLPGPTNTKYSPELKSGAIIVEAKTMKLASDVTASIAISSEQQIVTEKIPTAIGNLLAFEVITTIPKGDHYSEATAIIEEEYRPFSFPGRADIGAADTAEFMSTWKKGFTEVVSHLIYTWWVNSTSKPTISIDNRFPESLAWTETTFLDSVLHDAGTIVGTGYTVPATTPSYTVYAGWIGTVKNVDGSVTAESKNRWKITLVKVTMK